MNSQTINSNELKAFYKDKKVLITGIHGFKGSWLALLLKGLGANVVGLGLPDENAILYSSLNFSKIGVNDYKFNITNRISSELISYENPDIVFHLAAQPIVSVGYSDPYNTYLTNVMGTINILEGVRKVKRKTSVINVTTDKVYRNYEKSDGYSESEELMGSDPYSSSKSCVELVNFAYKESYFSKYDPEFEKVISTVRAGNVIGGGDFASDRIVPDIIRSLQESTPVSIRNFSSVRPYQHVLDVVLAYAILAKEQYLDSSLAGEYNIGPDSKSIMTTKEIVDFAVENYGLEVIDVSNNEKMHETNILTLNSSKFRETFNWSPIWESKESILFHTFDWYDKWMSKENVREITIAQIREIFND